MPFVSKLAAFGLFYSLCNLAYTHSPLCYWVSTLIWFLLFGIIPRSAIICGPVRLKNIDWSIFSNPWKCYMYYTQWFFQHAQRIKSQLSKIKKSLIKTAQSTTHLSRENSMIGKENGVVIENTSKPTWHLTSRMPWTKNYLLKKQLFCQIKNCAENFTLTQWFKFTIRWWILQGRDHNFKFKMWAVQIKVINLLK